MAFGETVGLKAAWHAFPLFIGATAALFLNPPKHRWAIPILLLVFMGIGELLGPILQSAFSQLSDHEAPARMVGAALGWTALKAAKRLIDRFKLSDKEKP
jgi:predicted MFS family arabinose efflux permease